MTLQFIACFKATGTKLCPGQAAFEAAFVQGPDGTITWRGRGQALPKGSLFETGLVVFEESDEHFRFIEFAVENPSDYNHIKFDAGDPSVAFDGLGRPVAAQYRRGNVDAEVR